MPDTAREILRDAAPVSVARTHGGAHVFGLAGFLGDDDLIGHNGSFGRTDLAASLREHIVNNMALQAASAQLWPHLGRSCA